MTPSISPLTRRTFLKNSLVATSALGLGSIQSSQAWPSNSYNENPNIIGPREGFTPHIGSILSMMEWMRGAVLRSVKKLSVEQLDHIHDDNANSIGSMLLHLAATEKYYQLHTFGPMEWGSWDESIKKEWDIPMNLGPEARNVIKGHNVDYYIGKLTEVREKTIEGFKNRDDAWLMTVDQEWGWGPTNNYCKWFHVCEHESNHNGQIKWIRNRLPGSKAYKD